MTLRQVWVRIAALPAEAPLMSLLTAEQRAAEQEDTSRQIDDVLAPFTNREG